MNSAVIMAGYLLLTIGIGIYISKSNKNSEEFLVAKKGLGISLIIPLLFSELIAGAGTIGNAERSFNSGLSSVWAQWGMSIGCILYVFLLSRFYWVMSNKLGVVSVPEALGQLFDKKTRTATMVILALAYGLIYATQPISAAAILAPMFNVSTVTMAWVVGIVIVLVTITGGLKGAASMSVVHSVVMYLGMFIAAFFVIRNVGGYEVMRETLSDEMFDLMEPGISTVFAWVLGTAFALISAPTVVAVTFGSKSLKSARIGIVIGSLLIIPFAMAPALMGMAAKIQLPGIIPKNALFTITSSVGSVIAGIASMGVVAAVLSTAPVVLLIVVTTLTRDLYKGIIKPNATDSEQMLFSRLAIVIIGLGGTYIGLQSTSILGQLLGALQIRSVIGVVLLIALIWPKVNSTAAFYSIITGGVLAAAWHFMGSPFGIEPLWPSLLVGIPVLIIITLLSKNKISPGYVRYMQLREESIEVKNC